MLVYKNIPGEIVWFIEDRCNYNCSYCFVDRPAGTQRCRVENYRNYLNAFRSVIPRGYLFTLFGGGEPFIHPRFLDIATGLAAAGYLLAVNSNFSAPIGFLREFFRVAEHKLVYFVASLHLEYADPNEFINRICILKKEFPGFTGWLVNSVALPDRLDELNDIRKRFEDAGIGIRISRYRLKDQSEYQYSADELKKLDNIQNRASEPRQKNLLQTKGKLCLCGCKYLVINPIGDVFRCTPAMCCHHSLGNILAGGFSLLSGPEPCREKECFCIEKYREFLRQYEI